MSNEKEKEWQEAYEAFLAKYPDCPPMKPIETLNLIMKKEFALDILSGKKKVEYRAYSKHYCERLYDKAIGEFIERHKDDEGFLDTYDKFVIPLRFVKNIHFHNYNNTWFMDCSVKLNDVVAVVEDDVKFMQEEFGCHELDEELETLVKTKAKRRPLYFYFVIDKVTNTNLK